jgi:L-cysteine/cystine lyase
VLVDGAQAVGAIPTAAAGIDFLTVSAQKWLCGPDATGALVVAEPERLRVGRPSWLAQKRHEPDGSFEPRPGAARFDSLWQASSTAGLLAALELAPAWRYERAAAMAALCRERLEASYEVVTPPQAATLVSWRLEGDLPARVAALHACLLRLVDERAGHRAARRGAGRGLRAFGRFERRGSLL